MTYTHFCGPRKTIHQVAGLQVLDPRQPYEQNESQADRIALLLKRQRHRFKSARESTSIK